MTLSPPSSVPKLGVQRGLRGSPSPFGQLHEVGRCQGWPLPGWALVATLHPGVPLRSALQSPASAQHSSILAWGVDGEGSERACAGRRDKAARKGFWEMRVTGLYLGGGGQSGGRRDFPRREQTQILVRVHPALCT